MTIQASIELIEYALAKQLPDIESRTVFEKVKRAMHELKTGTLRSGRSGRKVTSRKQAIAIGLSEARQAGAKVPRKRVARKK